MFDRSIKDGYNEPLWDSSKFTKPNGRFESNNQKQQTFVPNVLPPSISYDNELVMLLAQAERKRQ